MEEQRDILIRDWEHRLPTDLKEEYVAHMFSEQGTCRYRFNEQTQLH
ncbi:MAG: hypothetical protein ACI3Z5_05590 [Paludibacteraceae bacterium]